MSDKSRRQFRNHALYHVAESSLHAARIELESDEPDAQLVDALTEASRLALDSITQTNATRVLRTELCMQRAELARLVEGNDVPVPRGPARLQLVKG